MLREIIRLLSEILIILIIVLFAMFIGKAMGGGEDFKYPYDWTRYPYSWRGYPDGYNGWHGWKDPVFVPPTSRRINTQMYRWVREEERKRIWREERGNDDSNKYIRNPRLDRRRKTNRYAD